MVVVLEVSAVTGEAGTAVAAIDRGVTVAVGPCDAGAVDAGMAGEAGVIVDTAHRVAGMAVDAERGNGNGG